MTFITAILARKERSGLRGSLINARIPIRESKHPHTIGNYSILIEKVAPKSSLTSHIVAPHGL
ncbi:hypothetical protein [Legionella sp. WA2022007384]